MVRFYLAIAQNSIKFVICQRVTSYAEAAYNRVSPLLSVKPIQSTSLL